MMTIEKLAAAAAVTAVLLHLGVGAVRVRAGTPAGRLRREIDATAFLRAIAERESGNDAAAVGRSHGERSKYQFTADTWALHTQRPFREATEDPRCADFVAAAHYIWLKRQLGLLHIRVTVRTLAAAWRYGQQYAKICEGSDYAHEVENLYESEVGR